MLACSNCESPYEEGSAYCTNCGEVLPRLEGARLASPSPTPALAYDVTRGRERTKTGLLLLTVGFLVTPIPYVNLVAGVLLIIAVILLLLGAQAFGDRHRRLVVWSVILYVILSVASGVVIGGLVFAAVIESFGGGAPVVADALWRNAIIGLGLTGAALAVPYMLVTHAIQDATGRNVLWLALIIEVVVAGIEIWYLLPRVDLFAGAGTGSIELLGLLTSNPVTILFALTALPWAYAYYLAYRGVSAQPSSVSPTRLT